METSRRACLDRWSALVPVFAVLYAVTASLFYVFSRFEPLEMHLLTSVERVFANPLPLLVVWIASLGSSPEAAPRASSPGRV